MVGKRRFIAHLDLTAYLTGLGIVSARLTGGLCRYGIKVVVGILSLSPLYGRAVGAGAVIQLFFAICLVLVIKSPITKAVIFIFHLVLGFYAVYYEIAVINGDNVCLVNLVFGLDTVYYEIAVLNSDNIFLVYLILGFHSVYYEIAVITYRNSRLKRNILCAS